MSRADRRKQEREKNKMEKWVGSLTAHQSECISMVVADKVKLGLSEYVSKLNVCLSNKLFMDYNTTVEENEKFINELENEYIEFAKWSNKKGSGWLDMLKNLDNEAIEVIKDMLEKKMSQKDIVKAIKKQYDLPSAAVNRSYKIAKEEWLKEKEETKTYDPEVEDGAKYIFEEPGVQEVEEVKEVDGVIEAEFIKPVVATTKATENGFEVISRAETVKMELKGKYADYKYENSNGDIVVNVDNEEETLTFLSLTDVDKYEFEEIEKFKARMREVKEVFRL